MRSAPLVTLALVALLAGAACSPGGAVSPTPVPPTSGAGGAPATSADLDGRTFLSTGATGHDLVAGSTVRLTFEGVRLGASAGCNQMGGEYSLTDGVLAVGPMMMTEMACDEPLMAQDQWLSGFLPGAAATLDGDTLTLARDGVTLTLLDEEVADPDRSLEGTRWVVDGIVTGDAVSSTPAGAVASLAFDAGTVTVETGCNGGSGSYTLGEGTVSFGAIGVTERACAEDVMALEAAVLQVLSGEATYAIDGGALTLMNGANGLLLRADS
jgi:heat shock protein HslJ